MADDAAELADLQMLGADAQRAVSAARAEAQTLGHPRIGTEHLLLGILADAETDATRVLVAAGGSLAAVRGKVREAKGPVAGGTAPSTTEGTARAARAIRRSVRFSRQRHNGSVTADDLLIGVLDVEGTAGQVLRSLGVDVDDVRERLGPGETKPASTAQETEADGAVAATCPRCDADLSHVVHQRVPSTGVSGTIEVLIHACPGCGTVIGLTAG